MKHLNNLYNKSYFYVFSITLLMFCSTAVNAIEVKENIQKVYSINKNETKIINDVSIEKGLFKRIINKIKTSIKKVYRRTVNKFKLKASKRKSKKDRMKSGFKNRHQHLYNILLFSAIFIVVAGIIIFGSLYLYLNLGLIIGLYLLYILGISLLLAAFVLSLIYFSNRYILKPRF